MTFEIKDALRKVRARDEGAEGAAAKGPMWKQLQEGVLRDGAVQEDRAAQEERAAQGADGASADDSAAGDDGSCCKPADTATSEREAIDAACDLLAAFDRGHRGAAASEGARGFGGALTANEWAATAELAPLADAVRVLWLAASRTDGYNGDATSIDDGRLILGICAEDAMSGVATLKAWVTALGLPKGPLHGMDQDGEPLDMRSFGSVYIKYNSLPPPNGVLNDPPGTARLSGYNGDFRGVYVNANLADGVFRQYAVLPLALFESVDATPVEFRANTEGSAAAAAAAAAASTATAQAVSATSAGSNTREGRSVGQQRRADSGALNAANVRSRLLELDAYTQLASLGLGIAVTVREADADTGRVVLSYDGPARLRRAVELNLRNALQAADPRVRRVDLVGVE